MRIGLISDTHLPRLVRSLDELGPSVAAFLGTVDLILHGGDVVLPVVFDWLEQFAPVIAAEGNNDYFADPRMRPRQHLDCDGWRIGMAHDLVDESQPLDVIEQRMFGRPLDILIGGHTHCEQIRRDGRRVLLNSGSAVLPRHYETRLGTVALLEVTADTLHAEIVVLGHSPDRPNPSRATVLDLHRAALEAE